MTKQAVREPGTGHRDRATGRGPRMPAEQRRELVLGEAMAAFAAHGYAGTSTEEVARRAGISQPYLFRLFPTKKALFLALVERCFERVGGTFVTATGARRATRRRSGTSPGRVSGTCGCSSSA